MFVHHEQKSEKDELRARFTCWLETVIRHARIDYLRKQEKGYEMVSIEEIPEHSIALSEEEAFRLGGSANKTAFDFEEERLAKAFRELPLMRQRVLEMLFIKGEKPDEIAAELHCSVQHVYNQRSLAIRQLRKVIEGGGNDR